MARLHWKYTLILRRLSVSRFTCCEGSLAGHFEERAEALPALLANPERDVIHTCSRMREWNGLLSLKEPGWGNHSLGNFPGFKQQFSPFPCRASYLFAGTWWVIASVCLAGKSIQGSNLAPGSSLFLSTSFSDSSSASLSCE